MGYRGIQSPKDSLFLVTGRAGFIGSNLCEALIHLGYRVRCLDDLSTGKNENMDLFMDNPNYEFAKGEVKDLQMRIESCKEADYVLDTHGLRYFN